MRKRYLTFIFALLAAFTFSIEKASACDPSGNYGVAHLTNIPKTLEEAPIIVIAKRHPAGVNKIRVNALMQPSQKLDNRFLQIKVVKTLKGKLDSDIITIDSTDVPCSSDVIFNFYDDNEHILMLQKIRGFDFYSAAFGTHMKSAFYFVNWGKNSLRNSDGMLYGYAPYTEGETAAEEKAFLKKQIQASEKNKNQPMFYNSEKDEFLTMPQFLTKYKLSAAK